MVNNFLLKKNTMEVICAAHMPSSPSFSGTHATGERPRRISSLSGNKLMTAVKSRRPACLASYPTDEASTIGCVGAKLNLIDDMAVLRAKVRKRLLTRVSKNMQCIACLPVCLSGYLPARPPTRLTCNHSLYCNTLSGETSKRPRRGLAGTKWDGRGEEEQSSRVMYPS